MLQELAELPGEGDESPKKASNISNDSIDLKNNKKVLNCEPAIIVTEVVYSSESEIPTSQN